MTQTLFCTVKKYFPQGASLGEILIKMSKLDIAPLKLATLYGAVWIQKKAQGKIEKIRDIRAKIDAEDKIWLYFDARVLELPPYENPVLIEDLKHYGVWWKPAGILSQGTQTGDHCSIMRAIEIEKNKAPFLVHRLDRETAGLILFAYSSEGARELSALMTTPRIRKIYQAIVLGDALDVLGKSGVIDTPIDGKKATTHFEVVKVEGDHSYLELEIETGRLHQIRKHLAELNLPIMGDPAYGKGNKNKDGLKLMSTSLQLKDPWVHEWKTWKSPESLF